jgi:WhiB family redox-sensing transcriptional regulator
VSEVNGLSWQADAACVGVDGDWFGDLNRRGVLGEAGQAATVVCQACPVRQECLDYALATEPRTSWGRQGIWGGTTPAQRATLARQRSTVRRCDD